MFVFARDGYATYKVPDEIAYGLPAEASTGTHLNLKSRARMDMVFVLANTCDSMSNTRTDGYITNIRTKGVHFVWESHQPLVGIG